MPNKNQNKNLAIGQVESAPIVEEMQSSYLDYAMSVIISRALPDVRDGLKPVHRRILYAMWKMGLDSKAKYRKSATVVGECFVKDTMILTKKGLVPIQDIRVGDQVYTQASIRKVNQLFETPARPLLKITLQNGLSNVATLSQKFKILTSQWKFEWKEAENLTKNDYLVVKTGYPEIQELVKLKRAEKNQPCYLNENIAYLLGFFISEGSMSEDYSRKKFPRMAFTNNDKGTIEKVAFVFRQEFNYSPTIEMRNYELRTVRGKLVRNKKYTVRVNRKNINEFFTFNFDLKGKRALIKEIPQQIFVSPKPVIFSFLRGLIDGDGSIHRSRNVIHYGSISKKLINQIQLLLQHQGIFCNQYHDSCLGDHYISGRKVISRQPFYYLEVESRNAVELAKGISLANNYKQQRVLRIAKGETRDCGFNYDIIPQAGKMLFQELSHRHLGAGWYQDTNGDKFRMGIKYWTGCKIRYSSDLWEKSLRKTQVIDWGIKEKLSKIGSPLFEFLNDIIGNKIYFLRVSKVKKIAPEKTYDFQVEHDHEFIANGMVSHNCLGKFHPHGDVALYDALARMAQDFSLRYPLIDGQGNWGCFTKDTKVRLTDGRSLSFGELIKEHKSGKKNYTFTINSSGLVEIAQIKKPRLTKKKAKIMKVILDNGEEIKCTLNHRYLVRDGSYREAEDLKPGDSLMPAYFNKKQIKDGNHYLSILQPLIGRYEFVHKLADEYNQHYKPGRKFLGHYILHHKNFNRWNNSPDNIQRLTVEQHYKIHLKQVKNLWKEKGDEFREKHRESLKRYFSKLEIRKKLSETSRKFWRDPTYQAKFPNDYFRKIARDLWKDPVVKKFHREKILQQRQDEEFRKKHIEGVRVSNKRRLEENPNMMRELTEKAKISLHKNWQDHLYKKRVIRSKILGYVYFLSKKYPKVTQQVYEKERYNNCLPRLKNALKYFDSFLKIIDEAKRYNHKVVKTRMLRNREDVYDLTTEPWHNFLLDAGVFVHNSIDNDPPAAQRYTECKLKPIAEELLFDLEKETVNFMDNYDGTQREPQVLPAKLPNLLLNGTMGIAVGMATNIPPHNLAELSQGLIYLIDHPGAGVEDLFKFIKGPDFPTGALIFNPEEIKQAYATGRGGIVMRAKAEIQETQGGQFSIIVSEIPYQVNKASLLERMALLVREKKIEGIKDLRDESDKEGLRMVIELKKDTYPQKILNRLYKLTQLQETFYVNMLALVNGLEPRVLTLKMVLEEYLKHRKEVIRRRTEFDLKKAEERAHILEGLKRALDHIDAVIKTIRKSKDREEAKTNLIKKFKLTTLQAIAILEMRLQQLAHLEQKKIEDELKEKKKLIKDLKAILKKPKNILELIKDELVKLKEKYPDRRRTQIIFSKIEEFKEEDIIPDEPVVVIITHDGYIKRLVPQTFRAQIRGGKGVLGLTTKEEDIVEHFFTTTTHANLLFFTTRGRVFQLKAYSIPEASRIAKGQALVNFLQISSDEKVSAVLSLSQLQTYQYLVMVTQKGIIKKVNIKDFENVRRSGFLAIKLKEDDELKWVKPSSSQDEIVLVTQGGQAIRFKEKSLRAMGRGAAGVIGIRFKNKDEVVGMGIMSSKFKVQSSKLLTISENGFGKMTSLKDYRLQGRGGVGIKTAQLTKKTGQIVTALVVNEKVLREGTKGDLVIISRYGQVIRLSLKTVPTLSRATQGVHLMRFKEKDDQVASVTLV